MSQRIAGLLELQITGVVMQAKGEFSYSPGGVKRTAIVGGDGTIHGYKEETLVPFIEGEITDRGDLDLVALFATRGATVTLTPGHGKMFVLRKAWWAGDNVANTDEANIPARFEGVSGEEVPA